MTDTLTAALARQQLLIVLDNCEQVIAAVAELCGTLLPAADDVRVLATSREPVGLAGETRYRLAPLAVPEPGREADGSEAMALFSDRARQADPRFRLDRESSPLVARLVRRLDGLPLALELAAARVDSLGLPQLLDRLDARLSLLIGADRLAAARHQSLAATVDWSYQLLTEAEQRVFRQLSVFPGPFTLEGARGGGWDRCRGGRAASGGLLAGRAAVNRPGRPVALPAAGHPAGLWSRPAGRRG